MDTMAHYSAITLMLIFLLSLTKGSNHVTNRCTTALTISSKCIGGDYSKLPWKTCCSEGQTSGDKLPQIINYTSLFQYSVFLVIPQPSCQTFYLSGNHNQIQCLYSFFCFFFIHTICTFSAATVQYGSSRMSTLMRLNILIKKASSVLGTILEPCS